MLMGVIYKRGKEIARGIVSGGKKWAEEFPEQYLYIYQDSNDNDEIKYTHDDSKEIYFQELQDNGKGWEVVYDSRERIDRVVEYPLPSWLFNNDPIPKYRHIHKEGSIGTYFEGYY